MDPARNAGRILSSGIQELMLSNISSIDLKSRLFRLVGVGSHLTHPRP